MQFDKTWRKAGGKSVNWRAWQAIVDYANTGDPIALREAFTRSLEAFAGASVVKALYQQIVESLTENIEESKEQAFCCWARDHHHDFNGTLLCVSTPVRRTTMREQILQLLAREAHGLRVFFEPTFTRKPDTRKRAVIFVPKLEECKSIVSPIYGFMFDRLVEREEGVGDAIPVGICERENCFKFMLLEREGRKRFCSDECRRLAFQQSSDNWNEYMREYRKRKRRTDVRRGSTKKKS